ncbi:MAG: hypothetical protein IPM81_01775 [Saprospirales bacterium]|nr:hypothetical protein [Saprospirales bacterium]
MFSSNFISKVGQIEHCEKLLSNAKTEEALKYLSDFNLIEKDMLVQISSRLASLERDSIKGILSRSEYELERNRITNSIVSAIRMSESEFE